jgi:hypothetical protein
MMRVLVLAFLAAGTMLVGGGASGEVQTYHYCETSPDKPLARLVPCIEYGYLLCHPPAAGAMSE